MGDVLLVASLVLPIAWSVRRRFGAPQIILVLLIALAGELLMRVSPVPDGAAWLDLRLLG